MVVSLISIELYINLTALEERSFLLLHLPIAFSFDVENEAMQSVLGQGP